MLRWFFILCFSDYFTSVKIQYLNLGFSVCILAAVYEIVFVFLCSCVWVCWCVWVSCVHDCLMVGSWTLLFFYSGRTMLQQSLLSCRLAAFIHSTVMNQAVGMWPVSLLGTGVATVKKNKVFDILGVEAALFWEPVIIMSEKYSRWNSF